MRARARFLCGLLALVGGVLTAAAAEVQYPSKPVRLIVPFPPGGGTEPIARLVGRKLADAFGHQVVIDNRPGAGTTIGLEVVARSPADGYTLLLGSIANAISATLYSKLNYDLIKDFEPITLLSTSAGVLVVHPALPVKSVKELIVLAKLRPGELAYSSSGNGTPNHLAAELFRYMTGVRWIHVPYKGGGPSMIALLSGEVSLAFASLPSAISQIRAGKLRALAVTTAQRWPSLPGVPTISASGVPGYEADTWYGLSAPAGTRRAIIARIHAETLKILKLPDVTQRLDQLGYQVRVTTPAEYAAFTRSEIEKWGRVIKAAGMHVD